MKTESFKVISKQDGLALDGLIISPEKPRLVLQICHGMCEHKERYIAFMEYLAKEGIACVIHDHRGHGRSVKAEKDLGYFYENGAEALVEDIHQVMKETKEKFEDIPYVLMGHSMGSLAVRCFIKKYDSEIDGLIVCGSPSANDMAGIGIQFIRFLQKIKGTRGRSKMIDNMVMGAFEKPFKEEHLKSSWICTDKSVVEAYNADPYCNYTFTLNGYEALMNLMIETYNPEGWSMGQKELPIHFIAGENDPCIGSTEQFHKAVQFLKNRGYSKVTAQLYKEMRHEILNETRKYKVFKDVLNFLNTF